VFLDVLRRRNGEFLDAAVRLHQEGLLPPNTYVLDLDAVRVNARALRAQADRLGLRLFAMTKQVGRHPDFCRVLVEEGVDEAVAVDLECAISVVDAGMRLGHVGHLVQIPRAEAPAAAALEPAFWTVFSEQKAREAAAAAGARGANQALLARVQSPGDRFYPGHEGGFDASDLAGLRSAFDGLNGGYLAGVTTFPAVLFDAESRSVKPTPNMSTIASLARRLRDEGLTVEVNAPGTTSCAMLPMLAELGATQVEPGHGFTGTTPWHAVEDLVETPAVAYVSEVSHLHGGYAYCFGGGLYVDPVLGHAPTQAIVAREPGASGHPVSDVLMPASEAIDYYARVDVTNRPDVRPGDSVVFGFRSQAFVTRANVAGISGVSAGTPAVTTVCSRTGRPVRSQPGRPAADR
jgi:predicted amino acid racemase